MKNFKLFIFLFPLFVSAQNIKPILSKLVDYSKEKIPTYCGYQTEYGVLKFELLESAGNFRKGDLIFIFQQCPREVMEDTVIEYENNQTYNLFIGKETDKKNYSYAIEICRKFYPKDKPKKFWVGGISKKQ